jgi:hypothetical protein
MKIKALFFALAFLVSCTTAKQAPEPCPLPHNIYSKETGRPICAHRFYNQ